MQTQIGTSILEAALFLESGTLVAIPTETVYGLAANALDEDAVVKIFEAKARPKFNPLIVHVKNVAAIAQYAELDALSNLLATHLMPGPLTLLLPKKNCVPNIVTAGSNKVAIRIPNHPLTQHLLQAIDFPLAAPSANPFGYVSPTTAQHVYNGLAGKIPYILDGGACTVGVESTIVEVIANQILVHRVGGIALETIEQLAQQTVKTIEIQPVPQTPGQLKSHYATTTPLLQGNVAELIAANKGKKIALITFTTIYANVALGQQYVLSPSGNLLQASQQLFAIMRLLDTADYDVIIAEIFPNEGLGKAINDRLQRAQVLHK